MKLLPITNQPVITLVRPKSLTGKAEHSIPLPSGKSFERLHNLRKRAQRSNQDVNMIRHDHIVVQLITSHHITLIVNRRDDHRGNLRPNEIKRTTTRSIQSSIQSQKSPPRIHLRREMHPSWKAPKQPPSDKNRPSNRIQMWQPPSSESHPGFKVPSQAENSQSTDSDAGWKPAADCKSAQTEGPINNRPQAASLHHNV